MTRYRNAALFLACWLIPFASAAAASPPIYDDSANARQLIAAAIREASPTRKNIVLDFGANWCPDCRALDQHMHEGALGEVIRRNFVAVYISVGKFDRNLDLAAHYGIPLQKGIPALAVLSPQGKLLYAQREGQFEAARDMNPASFLAFFKKWEPQRK